MATDSVREGGSTTPIDGGGTGFRIPVARGQIVRTYRDGDDLVVVVAGGETLHVKGFFAAGSPSESVLILNAASQDGGYEVAEVSSEGRITGTVQVSLGQLEEMFGRRSSDSGEGQNGDGTFSPERSMGLSPMAIGAPLGLLVAGAAIGGGGGGDDGGGGDSPAPSQQPQPEYQPAYQPSPAPSPAAQPETPAPQQPQNLPQAEQQTSQPPTPQQSQKQVQPPVEQPAPQPAVQQYQPAETPQTQRAAAPQSQTQQGPGEVEIDTSGAGRFEHDDDGDGTVDRIVERIDADGDGRFEEVTTETFVKGVRDSRTYEQDIDDDGDFDQRDVYRYNGEGQLVRLERDEYADGVLDSVVTHSYHASGTTESTEYDLQADGVFERKLSFSPAGLKVREEVDSNNDGTMDRVDAWSHHANGTVERHDADYQNDGTVDKSVSYDSSGRKVRRVHDPDADGTKETTEWSYHGNGRVVARERTDSDSDGNFERIRADTDAERSWDWIGHDSDDDGGLDRVEVVDGDAFASGLGLALTAELAGVGTIDLSGGGGSAVLTLTDGDLTGLAGGASDYALAVDGGSGDTVRFGDSGIYDTGRSSGGRREYRGSDGEVLVKTGVSVEGVQDPLDALRENLAEATAEMFGLAGIQDVTSDSLTAVKKVIGAYGGRVASLTLGQLQNLVEVATDGIAVPASGTLEGASLVQGGLALDISTDADSAIEQRVVVSLESASLAPAAAMRNIDTDGDGTRDDRRETDSDYDGTADRVETWTYHANGSVERHAIDSDGDGTVDTATTYDASGRRVRLVSDSDGDGTQETETWSYHANGTVERHTVDHESDGTVDEATTYDAAGQRVRLDSDSDGDGTKETTVWSYHAGGSVEREKADGDSDGNFERTSVDTDADGSWDWIGHDADDDGGLDRVEVVDGDAFAAGIASGTLAEFAGVGTVDLNGRDGTTDLALTDSSLTALADGAANYELAVDGGSGDAVQFGDSGIYDTGRSYGGRREYRGSDGKVLVQAGVSAEGVQDPLDALRENLAEATVEMFGLAGIRGVNAGNLDDVKLVIGAFGARIASLTLGQLQNLADIVLEGVAVRAGEDLLAAAAGTDSITLDLSVDANAEVEQREKSVTLDLESGTLAPASLTRTVDLAEGGWDQHIETDSDYDGALNSEAWAAFDSGGEDFRRIVTDEYADGVRESRTVEDNFGTAGELETKQLTRYNGDGNPTLMEAYYYTGVAWLSVSYTYPDNGTIGRMELNYDGDGTVDSVETDYYLGSSGTPDYTVYDGTGILDRSDGTPDSLEYFNRMDLEHTIDGSDAALAGIADIELAGQGGATTLIFADGGLAGLADGAEHYVLVIDGDSDDVVRFIDGSVQATGERVGRNDEYQHPSGRILIDSDIRVEGAIEAVEETVLPVVPDTSVPGPAVPDPLAQLLANLAGATVEMFEQAGVVGVTSGNIADVKTVISAYGDAVTSLTLEQVQNLASIGTGGIAVPAGGTLEGACLDDGGIALDINTNADVPIEQVAIVSVDTTTLAPVGVVRRIDTDGDGTLDDREIADSNFDGTQDSRIARFDADGDGTYEKTISKTFTDGTPDTAVIEKDFNDNGTNDKVATEQYVNGTLDSKTVLRDYNEDGTNEVYVSMTYEEGTKDTANVELDRDHDGTHERVTHTVYASGTRDTVTIERDADDSGTNERVTSVRFTDGTLESSTDLWDLDEDGTSEGVTRTAYDDGTKESVTVEWDYDGDGSNERVVTTTFVDGVRSTRVAEWDYDGDGTYDSIKATRFSDGTRDSRTKEWDLDGDGSIEKVVVVTYSEGTRDVRVTKWDRDGDGIYENVITADFVDGTLSTRTVELDSDDDGAVDSVVETTFTSGARNTRTDKWDYDNDGTWDQVNGRTDADRDGTYETLEAETFSSGVRTNRIVKRDVDDDGSFDWREVSVFNAEGEMIRRKTDSNNDGTVDRMETWTHHASGSVERHAIDYENDGIVDNVTTYDAEGRRVRLRSDSDGDGTKETTVWAYHASGSVERESVDGDSDGNFERVNADMDADGSWDWIGHDNNDDDVLDRVEVVDGDAFAAGLGEGVPTELAGVGTIDLTGGGGSAVLMLTDGEFNGLAVEASDYVLTIDGGSGDTVRFAEGGFDDTGTVSTGESGNEYREYRGSSGRLLIDSDINVEGAAETAVEPVLPTDPDLPASNPADLSALARLLANLATATVEMFERAGITGVNNGNLDDVKIVVGAYGDAVSTLTSVQVQSLTDIATAGTAVWLGDDVRSATVDSTSMSLEVSTDFDDDIEYRVVLDIDSNTLTPTSLVRTIEPAKMRELHGSYVGDILRLEDNDYDGTLDKEVWLLDNRGYWEFGENGTFEAENIKTFVNGIPDIFYSYVDSHEDGTYDQKTVTYHNSQGVVTRIFQGDYILGDLVSSIEVLYHGNGVRSRNDHDFDADGTPEMRTAYDESGRVVFHEVNYSEWPSRIQTKSYHDSGAVDVSTLDSNSDGTVDQRNEYNTRGWRVMFESDQNLDGTFDTRETWSHYANGYVESHEVDRGADGTVEIRTLYDLADQVKPGGISEQKFHNFRMYLDVFNDAKRLSADDMTMEQLENLAALARGIKKASHWRLGSMVLPESAYETSLLEEEGKLTLRMTEEPVQTDSVLLEKYIEIGLNPETFANLGEYKYVYMNTRDTARYPRTHITTLVWSDENGLTERTWETDNRSDGTIDSRRTETYSGWPNEEETSRWERDEDADGTPEEIEISRRGDNFIRQRSYDRNDDGTVDFTIICERDAMGLSFTPNRVIFADGVDTEGQRINFLGELRNWSLDGETVVELAGMDNGTNGASEVYLTDWWLTGYIERWNSSNGEEKFGLTINGDNNDKVIFNRDGIRRIEDGDDAMSDGMHIYEATHGRLYIDPDVTVEFV